MISNLNVPRPLVKKLESVEINCWESIFSAADNETTSSCGIDTFPVGKGLGTIVANVDILGFNRVFGLGLGMAVTGDDVNYIIGRYSGAGVNRFFVQLDPIAKTPELVALLSARGFSHYNNWVRLFRDIEKSIPAIKSDLIVNQIGKEHSHDFARIVCDQFHWPDILHPWFCRHSRGVSQSRSAGVAGCQENPRCRRRWLQNVGRGNRRRDSRTKCPFIPQHAPVRIRTDLPEE
jgi:hypothetical protein